jgi:hypothetical protein
VQRIVPKYGLIKVQTLGIATRKLVLLTRRRNERTHFVFLKVDTVLYMPGYFFSAAACNDGFA